MTLKPIIASPGPEFDCRTVVLADQAPVITWDDSSPGGSNDADGTGDPPTQEAIGVAGAWSSTVPGVRFKGTNVMSHLAWGVGFPNTLFAVIEVTDVATGAAIVGTTDGIVPDIGLYLLVFPDGSLVYRIGGNGATPALNLATPPGFVSNGKRMIIAARQDAVTGMILKVNGLLVAQRANFVTPYPAWFAPRLGQANLAPPGPGGITGTDRLMGWVSGYAKAASDAEVVQMENFLSEVFAIRLQTAWGSCAPDPATVWASCT